MNDNNLRFNDADESLVSANRPYEIFDLNKLKLLPLSERIHDMNMSEILELSDVPAYENESLDAVCDAVISAREKNASVILMYGAHMIKRGCSKLLINLIENGWVTHLATNGAGAIHDFELAMIGATTESVAKYISEGQFGLWNETGKLNDIVADGARRGFGFGESVGKYICENNLPNADISVLAAGYRSRVPVTVHVGIGSDIVHEHPNFDAAAVGKASHTDFLIYAKSTQNLEGGAFLNFGSAVTGPEVYLKCLAMARNVAKQENKKIADFTTAVFDVLPFESRDYRSEPKKSDYMYYFRPWKTILARTVADGGRSYYIEGDHRATLGNLVLKLNGRK